MAKDRLWGVLKPKYKKTPVNETSYRFVINELCANDFLKETIKKLCYIEYTNTYFGFFSKLVEVVKGFLEMFYSSQGYEGQSKDILLKFEFFKFLDRRKNCVVKSENEIMVIKDHTGDSVYIETNPAILKRAISKCQIKIKKKKYSKKAVTVILCILEENGLRESNLFVVESGSVYRIKALKSLTHADNPALELLLTNYFSQMDLVYRGEFGGQNTYNPRQVLLGDFISILQFIYPGTLTPELVKKNIIDFFTYEAKRICGVEPKTLFSNNNQNFIEIAGSFVKSLYDPNKFLPNYDYLIECICESKNYYLSIFVGTDLESITYYFRRPSGGTLTSLIQRSEGQLTNITEFISMLKNERNITKMNIYKIFNRDQNRTMESRSKRDINSYPATNTLKYVKPTKPCYDEKEGRTWLALNSFGKKRKEKNNDDLNYLLNLKE